MFTTRRGDCRERKLHELKTTRRRKRDTQRRDIYKEEHARREDKNGKETNTKKRLNRKGGKGTHTGRGIYGERTNTEKGLIRKAA